MRKLNTIEEINNLKGKYVINLFSNFEQVENGHSYEEQNINVSKKDAYKLCLLNAKCYIDNEEREIFDLGNNYIMINKKSVTGDIVKIYKVIE